MKILLRYKMPLLGMLLGAMAGYAYYYFVGCLGGTCAITANPINSTLYGLLLGGLLLMKDGKQTEKNTTDHGQG